MEWRLVLIIIAFAFFVYFGLLQRKVPISKEIARITPVKKKLMVFATPHRIEIVMLSLFFFFFFISDLAQNKFLDLGTDYMVTVFWHTKALALDVWVIFLILFHIALMGLFLNSLRSKSTSNFYDVIVGVVAFFGVAILLAGAIVQIYATNLHFLFMNFKALDFYHIGVYIEMLSGFYWAFTK